eukprot:TRINITY_DN80_c0_g1_i1.p1 TRINITY_DN80_c0_g1~~TRINITY_DN80_c0_g1_i1.p1  ORF type:complete len:377 (-),score=77.34 TRINITY_DN80_c0_g1_i1:282-1355(-)
MADLFSELDARREQMNRQHELLRLENYGGSPDPRITPEMVFFQARRSAGRVKKQLDGALAAKQAQLGKDDLSSNLFKMVKYYKMIADLYEENVKIITTVVAYLNHEMTNGKMEESAGDRIYENLVRLLKNMEKTMRRVLGLSSSEIGERFEAVRLQVLDFFQALTRSATAHPQKSAAVVGGVAGAVLLHKHMTGVCITAKILTKLGLSCGCAAAGWLTAAAVSAVGGLFLLALGKVVYHALYPTIVENPSDTDLRTEPAVQFEDINAAIENLRSALADMQEDGLVQELRKVAAYWDHFNDFDPQLDTDGCPVCFSNPPRQPVRFRGCTGRHFHCSDCRERCIDAHLNLCTLCRQPAP